MRESERSNRETADDSERSGEDQPRSHDTITTTPDSGAAPPPPGDDPPRTSEAPASEQVLKPEEAPTSEEAPASQKPGKLKKFRKPRKPSRGLFALIGLVIVGLAALGGGVFGLVWAFTRVPNSAQVTAAANAESAQQWRWLTAGKIFPATVRYPASVSNAQTSANLVGIAPQAPCAKAADKATAKALVATGCVTVLRATYTDASHTLLDTVGIAVMKSPQAANDADAKLGSGTSSGLLPVSFPGTVSSLFTSRGRASMDTQAIGRYVVFDSGGYADGRKGANGNTNDTSGGIGLTDLEGALSNQVMNEFVSSSNPCADREVRCSY